MLPVPTSTASYIDQSNLVCDASSLMLPPGQWPFELEAIIGNCMPFVGVARARNGDYVRYRQPYTGLSLKVFNT